MNLNQAIKQAEFLDLQGTNGLADFIRQQQAEIDALKKLKAENDALDKKLFESIKKSNEMWDKAAESLLKKAKSEG
jgi:hypothetical protein